MKVLERIVLENGVEIQLEDWNMENSEKFPKLYGYTIAAYPIAKNGNWIIKKNNPFRLSIPCNNYVGYTNEMVLSDYMRLKLGEITLEDLSEKYGDKEKAKYFMGLRDTLPQW